MIRAMAMVAVSFVIGGCGWIGGDGEIKQLCADEQPYQAEHLNDSIEVPEDLDSLDTFKEMPIPKAETPPRPEDAGCITQPPSIRTE